MECKKCNLDKTEEDFAFKNKAKGILHCVCKICQREYKRKYYRNNIESHYERNKITKDKLTDIIKNEKDKGCFICGEDFHECLEFHHLEKEDKLESISVLKNYGSTKKMLEELKKCVLLCANCHRKAHYNTEFNNSMLKKLNAPLV